jgi:hypothetical protein
VLRVLLLCALGVIGIGIVWRIVRDRTRDDDAVPPLPRLARLKPVQTNLAEFDRSYAVPGSPMGIATNGSELVIGNRSGGVSRVRSVAGFLSARGIDIIEPRYGQKIGIDTLTWNGTHYVGYTTAAWFADGSEEQVFTVHDPESLQVISHTRAPDLLGCLAWDGKQYWAATRKHTRDHPEPALLYRLDRDFRVLGTSDAPGAGCQGLAWDGSRLWYADVFSDAIFILDVSGPTPRVVHTAETSIGYLSGLVFFDGEIWVTEYGDNRLHRVRPSTRIAWLGGAPPVVAAAAMTAPVANDAPILSDRDGNVFSKRAPDDMELIEWSAELRGDQLFATWKLWYGPELFEKHEQAQTIVTVPQFARYEITVVFPDGRTMEKEFEAAPGENVKTGVLLADAAAPGSYRVELFLHVQYVTRDGTARILNNSAGFLELRK